MAKLPAFHFYPGDWYKDNGVRALDCLERGAWLQMLIAMFDSSRRGYLEINGQPYPCETLAHTLAIKTEDLEKAIEKMKKLGVVSEEEKTGILYSRRMVEDEKKYQLSVKTGKKGGKKRVKNQREALEKSQGAGQGSPETESESENEVKGLKDNEQTGLDFTIEDQNLATVFRKDIIEFKPDYIFEKSVDEMAHDIRFIRRSKKKAIAQILELWSWARQSEFWKTVILTPSNLNKNWGQLEIQRDRNPEEGDIDSWMEEQKEKERAGEA